MLLSSVTVLGILESDNQNSSIGQQQNKRLDTIYIYHNIGMIALRGSTPKALQLARAEKLTGISSNLGIPWPPKHKRLEIGIYLTLAEQNLIRLSFL